MANKSWFHNGYTYTRQQVGSVVLIKSVSHKTGEEKTEVYKVQRNGLEVFQGYAK